MKTESSLNILTYSWMAWFVFPLLFLFIIAMVKFDLVKLIVNDGRFWSAFLISLFSALLVIVLTPFFAIPTAYLLTYHPWKYKRLIEAVLINLPQTFPPVAVGVIYLFAFGPTSSFNIAYTFIAVVIAKLYVSAPFTLDHTLRKFREIKNSKVDLVARSLGAGTGSVLRRVLIPLARRDIAAGLTLSWARAMGEFGGSLIFAGVIAYKTEILPTYTNRMVSTDPFLSLAATAVLTVFAIIAIIVIRRLVEGKR